MPQYLYLNQKASRARVTWITEHSNYLDSLKRLLSFHQHKLDLVESGTELLPHLCPMRKLFWCCRYNVHILKQPCCEMFSLLLEHMSVASYPHSVFVCFSRCHNMSLSLTGHVATCVLGSGPSVWQREGDICWMKSTAASGNQFHLCFFWHNTERKIHLL